MPNPVHLEPLQTGLFDGAPASRSYIAEVQTRIAGADQVATESLASVRYGERNYSLLACLASCSAVCNRPWVLISGGMHGDEIAGVYAAIEFLESRLKSWQDQFQFAVLPCVNPSGFECGTLTAANGANLNRLWGISSRQPEVLAIEKWLDQVHLKFLATFDLHEVAPDYRGEGFVESDNPRGCYLYETVTDSSRRIGRAMIDALPSSFEVCHWPHIYGDVNQNGVVSYPEGCRNPIYAEGTSFDGYLNGRFTRHSFTLETPLGWTLEKRVKTQLIWLETALQMLSR